MIFIIYLIGAAVAYMWLLYLYDTTPDWDRVETGEAMSIFCVGMLASWLTVALIAYGKLFRNNDKE